MSKRDLDRLIIMKNDNQIREMFQSVNYSLRLLLGLPLGLLFRAFVHVLKTLCIHYNVRKHTLNAY